MVAIVQSDFEGDVIIDTSIGDRKLEASLKEEKRNCEKQRKRGRRRRRRRKRWEERRQGEAQERGRR